MEFIEFLKNNDFRFLGELLENLSWAIDKAIYTLPYLIGLIVIFIIFCLWIDEKIKKAEAKERAKKRSPKQQDKRAS